MPYKDRKNINIPPSLKQRLLRIRDAYHLTWVEFLEGLADDFEERFGKVD